MAESRATETTTTKTTLRGKHSGPPIPVVIHTGARERKDEYGSWVWTELDPAVTVAEDFGASSVRVTEGPFGGAGFVVIENEELPPRLFDTYAKEIDRAAHDARQQSINAPA